MNKFFSNNSKSIAELTTTMLYIFTALLGLVAFYALSFISNASVSASYSALICSQQVCDPTNFELIASQLNGSINNIETIVYLLFAVIGITLLTRFVLKVKQTPIFIGSFAVISLIFLYIATNAQTIFVHTILKG